MTVETILTQRKEVHGNFIDNARNSQQFKTIIHHSTNWDKLTPLQKEALDMIVHKVARIINGNPNEKDHWEDIAGYAILATKTVE